MMGYFRKAQEGGLGLDLPHREQSDRYPGLRLHTTWTLDTLHSWHNA